MDRTQAIYAAGILRHGKNTFVPSTGEEKTHISLNAAKRYVRESKRVCVSQKVKGEGIIQMRKDEMARIEAERIAAEEAKAAAEAAALEA